MSNIVITGFSGTGKSQVAIQVAKRLNWNAIDTDVEVVKLARKPISEIFKQDGESKFRELEHSAIETACQQEHTVIAIGGGAIVYPHNYELLTKTGWIVCLEAKPEIIYDRLFQESNFGPKTEVRPLLTEENPLERIKQLKASRQFHYANVDWTIHTDNLSVDEVAEEVLRAWRLLWSTHNDMGKPGDDTDKDMACMVETPTRSYPVFVGHDLLDKLGEKMKQADLSGTSIVISDKNVFSFYGGKAEGILKDAGFEVKSYVVPPGETSKSIDYAAKIYDFLVEHRIERDDIIVALGGGMVGDLAGFAAATFLRGISWIQVPTSLIAMVDASIGGKVGVNHPQGKNLIGAFYQPNFVLADCGTLATLPQRELTSGWAEVIKHGLILDKSYFEFLKSNAERIKHEPDMSTKAIAWSAAIKAQIVSEDEKERGKRTLLNYGHTIAHGLEAATQYRYFLHGEAVAIGMMGAAKLSQKIGLLSPEAVRRQQSLLQSFGLPTSLEAERSNIELNLTEITQAMELDKKMMDKTIRWVLLQDIGKAVIRSDVHQQDVLAVLQELMDI